LLTLPWSVTINVVNDRNVMRINEVYLLCIGKIMNRESVLKTFTAKPDAVNVLSGESHKNLDLCTSPKPNAAVQAIMARVTNSVKPDNTLIQPSP